MSARAREICAGNLLSPEQQGAYRKNWATTKDRAAKKQQLIAITATPQAPCRHLGEHIRDEICQLCSRRGKVQQVHACAIWGLCSILPYRAGQPEATCKGCRQYSAAEVMETTSPVSNPYGIPVPPNCTPLPAGRETFNGTEWRQLPREHQEYYRAVRRAREAATPAPATVQKSATSLAPDSQKTPFSDPAGRPVWLSHIGQGASAFLVLGGPSLLTHDLTELRRRGCFTMAVNNSATMLRPNAWIFVDPPSKFHDSIWRDPGVLKFVHRKFLQRSIRTRRQDGSFGDFLGSDGRRVLISELPGVIGIERNANFDPPNWLQEPSINWGMSKKSAKRAGGKYPHNLNSMFASIKTLYAIGFRVIYLLGCDFRMSADQPYAFPQAKSAGAVASNNGTFEKLSKMFAALKPHFDSAGLHIFNCNRDSALTLFPFVPFSEAIETATRGMETADVLRADGWYEGHGGA